MENHKKYCAGCSYLIEKIKYWYCDNYDMKCKDIKKPNCINTNKLIKEIYD